MLQVHNQLFSPHRRNQMNGVVSQSEQNDFDVRECPVNHTLILASLPKSFANVSAVNFNANLIVSHGLLPPESCSFASSFDGQRRSLNPSITLLNPGKNLPAGPKLTVKSVTQSPNSIRPVPLKSTTNKLPRGSQQYT